MFQDPHATMAPATSGCATARWKRNASPVIKIDAQIVAGRTRIKGSKGTEPQTRKPRKVMSDTFPGERLMGGQAMLLGHHGFNPTLTLPGNHIHGAVQCLALESLGLEDLANLLAFAFGR